MNPKNYFYTLIILILFLGGKSNAQTSPQEIYNRGVEAFRQSDFEKAVKYLDEYIASGENDVTGYNYRGLSYMSMKNYSKAIEDFSSIIAVAPRNLEALVNRGNVYILTNNYTSAIKDFTDALNIDPKNIDASLGRARAHMDREEYAKATVDLDAALSLDPENSRIYIVKTYLAILNNDTSKIFENVTSAVRFDSVNIFTNFRRDQIYMKVANYNRVLQQMDEMINRYPENYLGYFNRGFVFYLMNNYENAARDLSRALAMSTVQQSDFHKITGQLLHLIERNDQ